MKRWIKQNALYLLGAFAGGVIGFLYWEWVGCNSGTCAITSSPRNSTLYFAFMGALLFGLFKKEQSSADAVSALPDKREQAP